LLLQCGGDDIMEHPSRFGRVDGLDMAPPKQHIRDQLWRVVAAEPWKGLDPDHRHMQLANEKVRWRFRATRGFANRSDVHSGAHGNHVQEANAL